MNLEAMQAVTAKLKRAKMSKDLPALMSLYHPEYQIEMPSLGTSSKGHAQIAVALGKFAATFSDYDRELSGNALHGDTFISWGDARVTLRGNFASYEANGQSATVMTFVLFRFENEQIIYEGHYWDLGAICRAAGVPVEAVFASLHHPSTPHNATA